MPLFGWWKPKCPVGLREKAWVELRLRWLAEQFGADRLTRGDMITPTEQFFPDDYDGTPEAARVLLDRLCAAMGVPPESVALSILPDPSESQAADSHKSCGSCDSCQPCESHAQPAAAETADRRTIDLDARQLADPFVVVTILAHRLAYVVLERRKLTTDEPDLAWTVALAAVCFGLGVFVANASVVETHHHSGRGSWSSPSRLGYLPSRMTGYALAILAWLRGEPKPAWARFLRHDAADAFGQGLDYLARTDDSLVRPENLNRNDPPPSLRKLLVQLEEGSGSEAVAALWELASRGQATGEAAASVAHCLTDRRPAIRAEAARTLATFGPSAQSAVEPLVDAMGDAEREVRAAAAYALGQLHLQGETAVPSLIDRLEDPETIETVAWALAQFGPAAAPALPRLLTTLRSQLGCLEEAIDYLVYAVRAIAPDPEAELRQLIESCDADLQLQADHLLPEPGPIVVPPGGHGWLFWADGPT
jgi:hypothetical protein